MNKLLDMKNTQALQGLVCELVFPGRASRGHCMVSTLLQYYGCFPSKCWHVKPHTLGSIRWPKSACW